VVASATSLARPLISSATTANPSPASPARAASIEAWPSSPKANPTDSTPSVQTTNSRSSERLHHVHPPKLVAAAIVAHDPDRDTVRATAPTDPVELVRYFTQ
jgi:hypothetical protein